MAAFLTDDWFVTLHADGVACEDVTVEITVVGGPGGDVKWHLSVGGGVLSAAAGGLPGADVALTLPYGDGVAMARGQLEVSVAFMRGTMKTAGDPGRLLDVLAATARPGFREARDALIAVTEF